MIILFSLYLAIIVSFLIDIEISSCVFSITFLFLFLLRGYLPSVPIIKIDLKYVYPGPKKSVLFVLFFNFPAVLAFLIYRFYMHDGVNLILDFEYMENIDYMNAGKDINSLYFLNYLLRVFYISFIFFILHWFVFSYKYFCEVKEYVLSGLIESNLNFTYAKLLFVFVPSIFIFYYITYNFIIILKGGVAKNVIESIALFMLSNDVMAMFSLIMAWCFVFVISWMVINILLLKSLIKVK